MLFISFNLASDELSLMLSKWTLLPDVLFGLLGQSCKLKFPVFVNDCFWFQTKSMSSEGGDFYLRYYVGHKGKFGHEFLEFEFRPDGKLRYANNSQYKNDTLIRKEAYVSKIVLDELKRIIEDSEIMQVCFSCNL